MLLFIQQNLQAGGSTNYTLTGLAGSYSVTGSSATLTKTSGSTAYSLSGLSGSYALTGGTATLTKAGSIAYSLTALSGSYTISGGAANLVWSGQATDTHDGWWAKQWQKKKKKPDEPIEVLVEELVDEVIAKAKAPKAKIPVQLPSTALQRAELIERILVQLIDDEDEFEIEMLML